MAKSGVASPTLPSIIAVHASLFGIVVVCYSAGLMLAWQSFGADVGPAFFPSAGITLAAFLLTGRSRWPTIVAAIVFGEYLVDLYYGAPPLPVAWFAAANAVEPLVGASLTLAWCGQRPDLRQRRDFGTFLAAGCLIGPMIGGLIGGAGAALQHHGGWLINALHWFAGDGLGVLVIATPILLWRRQPNIFRQHPVEMSAALAGAVVVSGLALWYVDNPSIVVLPVMVWAALRLDMVGAALVGAAVGFVANVATKAGHGLLVDSGLSVPQRLALTQGWVAVIVLTSLLIAQESAARLQATRQRDVEIRERKRLEALSHLAGQLASASTVADIGGAIEAQLMGDVGAHALNLGLLASDGRTLQWPVMSGYPPAVVAEYLNGVGLSERTAATDAVQSGQPVIITSSAEYARRYPTKTRWLQLSGAHSLVAWPLSAGGDPIGALLMVWPEPRELDEAQLAYISAAASMVSQALARAKIYNDEHVRAAVLQSAVFPKVPSNVGGLDVCAVYDQSLTGAGLGGEWYDVMALPKDRVYMAAGFVEGHGLAAVEDMAQLRTAGRALALQGLPPAQLIAQLDGLTRTATTGKEAAAAVAVFDAGTDTLTYSSAGYLPVLMRRADTGAVVDLAEGSGPALGSTGRPHYATGSREIGPGDILVILTGALAARCNNDGRIAAAEELIAGWDSGTPLEVGCGRLVEALEPEPRRDDVCMLAVRFPISLKV